MSVPGFGRRLVRLAAEDAEEAWWWTVAAYTSHDMPSSMFQRSIPPDEIFECIRSGEVIANDADDSPYPSALLLGFTQGAPLHVLVARDDETGKCYVATVYRPDPELWGSDFKTRREP